MKENCWTFDGGIIKVSLNNYYSAIKLLLYIVYNLEQVSQITLHIKDLATTS